MFKEKYLILLLVAVLIASLVGPAQAFELGSTDGIWLAANPEGTTPDNIAYHSGPMPSTDTSTNAFSKTNYYSMSYIRQSSPPNQSGYFRTSDEYPNQGIWWTANMMPANDWNQVSYGYLPYASGNIINEASRFAWLGNTDEGSLNVGLNNLFLVGKFCHINRPIPAGNMLKTAPLEVTINNITCDPGWKLEPIAGETDPVFSRNMKFVYKFELDETPNLGNQCYSYGTGNCLCWTYIEGYYYFYNTCKYHSGSKNPSIPTSLGWPANGGGGCTKGYYPYTGTGWSNPQVGDLNYNGCADRIAISSEKTTTYFTCVNIENPSITKKYTISMLGTMKAPSNTPADDCPQTADPSQISYNVGFTSEKATTCMCAYGAVTGGNLTPVEVINFMALGSTEGIKLSWETTAEMDNLGFNLYRSTSFDGERELVNESVIISESPGGGMGATYEYMDTTVPAGITYYYWLQDIPLDDTIEPVDFGPLEALRPLR